MRLTKRKRLVAIDSLRRDAWSRFPQPDEIYKVVSSGRPGGVEGEKRRMN